MHMDDIMCKLQLGGQRLKESIISVMEEMGEEECKLQDVRDSKPELKPGHWDVLLRRLKSRVVSTAWARYHEWFSRKYLTDVSVQMILSSSTHIASSAQMAIVSSLADAQPEI
jgi:hypothetical protein